MCSCYQFVPVTSQVLKRRTLQDISILCFLVGTWTLSFSLYIIVKSVCGMSASLHCSEKLLDAREETCPDCILLFHQPLSKTSFQGLGDPYNLGSSYLPIPTYALSVQNCETFCRYREHTYMWMLGVVFASWLWSIDLSWQGKPSKRCIYWNELFWPVPI